MIPFRVLREGRKEGRKHVRDVFFFWLYLSYCMEEEGRREEGEFENFLSAKE